MKMNATGPLGQLATVREIDEMLARVAAVREVMGDEGGVAVDFHGRVTPGRPGRCAACSSRCGRCSWRSRWCPSSRWTWPGSARRRAFRSRRGERLYSRWDFRPAFAAGIAVAQPDLSHAGGVSECRRIASMAEAFGVAMAPHCPLGPIALAACLQMHFATPNTLIQEMSWGIHYNVGGDLLDYLVDPSVFAITDGHVPGRPAQAWASRSTRPPCAGAPISGTAGARRRGGSTTAASPSGEPVQGGRTWAKRQYFDMAAAIAAALWNICRHASRAGLAWKPWAHDGPAYATAYLGGRQRRGDGRHASWRAA